MTVSILPIIIPMLVALGVSLLWKFTMSKPVNHWAICTCIGVIAFFNFTICVTISALFIIVYHLLLKKKNETDK